MTVVRAASLIARLPDGRVLLGTRTPAARSWHGTRVFPGGGVEDVDARLPLRSRSVGDDAIERACALREAGEEAGLWLLALPERRDDPAELSVRRNQALAALATGAALLDVLLQLRLVLDDKDLIPVLREETADGRFMVRQLLLPLQEAPTLTPPTTAELDDVGFFSPSSLRRSWREGRTFLIPPIRRALGVLAAHEGASVGEVAAALASPPTTAERITRDLVEGIAVIEARSPTLPPATHTNCVVLGAQDVFLVDPAAPWDDARAAFDETLLAVLGERRVAGIFVTHHHIDHVGDVERLAARHQAPVWAHPETAARLPFAVDHLVQEGAELCLPGDPARTFRAVHTPGHARGHLCLLELNTSLLIAGDMVASTGSILIDPDEGDMATYLASLQRLIDLAPGALIPAHGPPIVEGQRRLIEQVAHRGARQVQVEEALPSSWTRVVDLVPVVYGQDTPRQMWPFAERSLRAALAYAEERGVAERLQDTWRRAPE